MQWAPVGSGLTGDMSGPTGLSERALGPDLARGFMLLFIALANSHYFIYGDRVFGGFPVDGGVGGDGDLDVRRRAGVSDVRGVVRVRRGADRAAAAEAGQEWWPIRKLLWRRSLVLVVLGFLHAMLLYVGDILAAYGVLLFLGVWALRWKDRWLFIVAASCSCSPRCRATTRWRPASDAADPSMLPPDFLGQFGDRIVVQPFIAGARLDRVRHAVPDRALGRPAAHPRAPGRASHAAHARRRSSA